MVPHSVAVYRGRFSKIIMASYIASYFRHILWAGEMYMTEYNKTILSLGTTVSYKHKIP